MSPAMSELLQTGAFAAAAFLVLNLLALFFKADAGTWQQPAGTPQP
jgi:hypothetical protein